MVISLWRFLLPRMLCLLRFPLQSLCSLRYTRVRRLLWPRNLHLQVQRILLIHLPSLLLCLLILYQTIRFLSMVPSHDSGLCFERSDVHEIARLKQALSREFEVKDLDQHRCFLSHEIFLLQRKYILDLLFETGILRCKPINTPVDANIKLRAKEGEPVDHGNDQRLVGKLIYLFHTHPNIGFAVSLVNQYMHDPCSSHLDAVTHILRHLKPAPGVLFSSQGHLRTECYTDADWASCLDDRRSTSGYCTFVGGNLVSWQSKKQEAVGHSSA